MKHETLPDLNKIVLPFYGTVGLIHLNYSSDKKDMLENDVDCFPKSIEGFLIILSKFNSQS